MVAPDPAQRTAANVAAGERTTLNELFQMLRERLARSRPALAGRQPVYQGFRAGDVRHSLADIAKAAGVVSSGGISVA